MCFSEERVKHSDIDRVEAAVHHTTDANPNLLTSAEFKFILQENGPITYE